MEKPFKFRHVNELTGLFVLGVLALVVAGVIFSGHSQRWFARKYAFDVLLPESGTSGLRRGGEVFILGVSAGLVDDIVVADDGSMKARVKIRHDFERYVRNDSTASVKKAFAVAGDSYLEISRGNQAPLPARFPVINCLPSEDPIGRMEKMLASLSAEFIPVVKQAGAGFEEWTRLGTELQKSRERLTGLLTRLENLAAGVEEGNGTIGKLLTETTLADDAQKLLATANQTMGELQQVATNLNLAVKDVQAGAAHFPAIAVAVANEGRDLPGLVAQTQGSMRELERLIEALQRHWLVRKYINKTNPPSSRLAAGNELEAPRKIKTPTTAKGVSQTQLK